MTNEEIQKFKEQWKEEFRKICEEIVRVQPMPNDVMKNLYESAKSEEWLKANGYEPVEKNGLSLMWIKKNEVQES